MWVLSRRIWLIFSTIQPVTMVVIGGMASVYGSVVGAVLLTALPQALTSFEGWGNRCFWHDFDAVHDLFAEGLVPTLATRFDRGAD